MPTIPIRWADNTDQLRRNLAQGLNQIEATRAAADKLVKSLSGENLLRSAANYAAAIDKIGGAQKLTASNQERVNAVMQRAVEQLEAAGKGSTDLANHYRMLAQQTELVDKTSGSAKRGLDGMQGSLASVNSLLGAFGVGLSVSAVVGFGRALLDNADALTKMHDRTGISIQGLQRLQVAGDDAGNTIEEMSGAINQMQNRLAGGDASAVGALKALGLTLADLHQMSPDRQFIAISDALRGVEDPAQQVSIAMDLFGKTGAQVLPTLKRGFDDLRDAAVGMSDDTVAKLDEMGDEMEATWRRIKNQSAEFFVSSVKQFEAGGNPYVRFFQQIHGEAKAVEEQLGKMTAAVQRSPLFNPPEQKDSQGLKSFILGDAAMREFERQMADAERLQREAASAAKQHADELSRLRTQIEAINRANAATPVRGPEFSFTSGTLPDIDRIRAIVAGMESLNRGGRPLGIDPQTIEQAIAGGGSAGIEQIGQRLPPIIRDTTTSGFASAVATLPELLQRAFTGGGGVRGAFQAFGAQIGGTIGEGLFKAGGLLNGLGNKLAGVFGSSLGLALPGIGQVVGSLLGSALPKVWAGIKKLFGGPSQEELGGRELEKQFESSFGSFDNMVNTVGEWYRATGRTSEDAQRDVKALLDATKDGPAAVQAWIDKLNAARDEAARLREADAATAEAEAESAVNAVKAVLDALTKQRDNLLQSIANEAPEEVMGVIESQIRGQVAALDAQIEAQRAAMEADAQRSADAVEDKLNAIEVDPVHIPVVLDMPSLPGLRDSGESIPIEPMADGAFGHADGPRLFYTAGNEDFAFSGEGRRFGDSLVPGSLMPGDGVSVDPEAAVGARGAGGGAEWVALQSEMAQIRANVEQQTAYFNSRFPKDLARAVRDTQRPARVGSR